MSETIEKPTTEVVDLARLVRPSGVRHNQKKNMANNYQESSSFLTVPKEKLQEAQEIITRISGELEEGVEGYCGCSAVVEGLADAQSCGVWFHGGESIDVEHVEIIARELVERLELDEPFFCSWSFTCSKPRIDEFGGGAFVIKRGYETYWCDARGHVEQRLDRGGLIPLTYSAGGESTSTA